MIADDRKPIGLLGGSFDPIHVGHVQFARDALQQLHLSRVLFVPAGRAWQKGAAADGEHRARMVEIAICGEARFVLDRRELRRQGPSYTVDTLRELRQELGPDRPLVLLIGADQLARLDTWQEWERLTDLSHLGVTDRPGCDAGLKPALARFRERHLGSAAEVAHRPAGMLVPVAMTPIDCSSTRIRALLGAASGPGDPALAGLLAPGVVKYIQRHRLYS